MATLIRSSMAIRIAARTARFAPVVLCLWFNSTAAIAKDTCFPTLVGLIEKDIAAGHMPGAVVVIEQGGKTLLDMQRGNLNQDGQTLMPKDAIFRIYSMAKPVTSVAIMMLVEQGKISLDDPVSAILPEFTDMQVATVDGSVPAERAITIRDMMRHTSGLTYEFFGEGTAREAYRKAGIGLKSINLSNQELAATLAGLPLEHQPGTTWEYSRATDVLGYLIEVVSGVPLDEFFKAKIFEPLGMEDTDFYIPAAKQVRAAGDFNDLPDHYTQPVLKSGGGGLVSTAQDYITFLRMLRNGGSLGDVKLLSPETVADMTRDHLFGDGMKPGTYYFVGHGSGFGLGFAVKIADHEKAMPGPIGTYSWLGYAGTSFWVDPANDLAAVVLVQTLADNLMRNALVRAHFYADFGLDGISAKNCLH